MTRYARILMTVCLVTLAASPALADFHGRGPGGFGHQMPMMMLLRHANLTPDQQTKIDQIMKSSFSAARPLMKQLHTEHENIADKLLSPGAMQAKDFTALQHEESELRSQLAEQMLATALKVRAVLTPAQLSKVAELHSKLAALHAQAHALLGDDHPPPPAE